MSRVVIWSGGADSTAMLDYFAGVSCKDYPVRAVSVVSHPYMRKEFMRCQTVAQKEYLKLAKKRGYWIDHERIRMSGNFKVEFPEESMPQQMCVWLGTIMPCVSDGDEVAFGYIKPDCMWHYRSEFVSAFHAMCAIKGVSAKVEFPFEWSEKYQIFDMLKSAGIPGRCWWSCDHPVGGKKCGECQKCKKEKGANSGRQE